MPKPIRSHKLDIPCPVSQMRTICGISLKSKMASNQLIAIEDDKVDCDECLSWMACRGYVRKEQK